jgi:hypothetical protein
VSDEQDAPVFAGDFCVRRAARANASTRAVERPGYLPHAALERGVVGALLQDVLLSVERYPDRLRNPGSRGRVRNQSRGRPSTSGRRRRAPDGTKDSEN